MEQCHKAYSVSALLTNVISASHRMISSEKKIAVLNLVEEFMGTAN